MLFLPGKVFFIDHSEGIKILGTAAQPEKRLFYISDEQVLVATIPTKGGNAIKAMMAIATEKALIQDCIKPRTRKQKKPRRLKQTKTDGGHRASRISSSFGLFG